MNWLCCCQQPDPPLITIARWTAGGSLIYRGVCGDLSDEYSGNGVAKAMAVNQDSGGAVFVYAINDPGISQSHGMAYHNSAGAVQWAVTEDDVSWEMSSMFNRLIACDDSGVYVVGSIEGDFTLIKHSLSTGAEVWTRNITETDWFAETSGTGKYIYQLDCAFEEIILYGTSRGAVSPLTGNYTGVVYDAAGDVVRSLNPQSGKGDGLETNPANPCRMLYHADGTYTYLENFGFFVRHYDTDWTVLWTLALQDPLSDGFGIWDPEGDAAGFFTAIAIGNDDNDVYVAHQASGESTINRSAIVAGTDGEVITELDQAETDEGQSIGTQFDDFLFKSQNIGGHLVIGFSDYDNYGASPGFARTGNIGVTSEADSAISGINFGTPPDAETTIRHLGVDEFGNIWATASGLLTTEGWS